GVGEYDVVPIEVIHDILDVPLDLGPLVADQFSGVVARDAGNIGQGEEFFTGKAEHEERVRLVLEHAERSTADELPRRHGSYPWCRGTGGQTGCVHRPSRCRAGIAKAASGSRAGSPPARDGSRRELRRRSSASGSFGLRAAPRRATTPPRRGSVSGSPVAPRG